jgi:hypothetical protein
MASKPETKSDKHGPSYEHIQDGEVKSSLGSFYQPLTTFRLVLIYAFLTQTNRPAVPLTPYGAAGTVFSVPSSSAARLN